MQPKSYTGNLDCIDIDKNDILFKSIWRLKKMNIKVVIEKGEDGYFTACCPALKSCWTQGKTEEEALKNIREAEAIELYLEPVA